MPDDTMTDIPATQRVAVYYNNRDVRVEERPVPEIGTGEILIRVRGAAVTEAAATPTQAWPEAERKGGTQ